MDKHEIIKQASLKKMVCLTYVCACGDCYVCTDSGGRSRYVCGRLDNGKVFAVKLDYEYLVKNLSHEELSSMGL